MRKIVILPLTIAVVIVMAELTIVYLSPLLGMLIHLGLLLLLLTSASILKMTTYNTETTEFQGVQNNQGNSLDSGTKNGDELRGESPPSVLGFLGLDTLNPDVLSDFFLAASLAPILRIFSLAMPLWFFPQAMWYSVMSLPMLTAAVVLANSQGLNLEDMGLTLNHMPIQILACFTGIGFGTVEYLILKPEPLVSTTFLNEILPAAVMLIIATGFTEELIFRGVIQTNSVKFGGKWAGLLFVAIIFAALHIGNSLLDALFVFPVGLFFGYLVLKTDSIIGATLSHGVTNLVLFVVAPLLIA